MARTGRPPIRATKRDQIDELILADLFSLREIAERVDVGVGTVRRRRSELFRRGDAEHDGTLAAHERRLPAPIRCQGACAGLITIVPCRACRALRLIESERCARQLGLLPRRQGQLFEPEELARKKTPPLPRGKFAPLIDHFRRACEEQRPAGE